MLLHLWNLRNLWIKFLQILRTAFFRGQELIDLNHQPLGGGLDLWVGCVGRDLCQDRFDESSIAINFFSGTFPNSFRGIAQLLKLRSNIGFRLWSYEFTSTDQHSNDAGRLRIDRERKDTISVG